MECNVQLRTCRMPLKTGKSIVQCLARFSNMIPAWHSHCHTKQQSAGKIPVPLDTGTPWSLLFTLQCSFAKLCVLPNTFVHVFLIKSIFSHFFPQTLDGIGWHSQQTLDFYILMNNYYFFQSWDLTMSTAIISHRNCKLWTALAYGGIIIIN